MDLEPVQYKHYIEIDSKDNITHGYSDAFYAPTSKSILLNVGGRQFELLGEVNPALYNLQGIALYKYKNKIATKKTEEEIQAEVDLLPSPPKTQNLEAQIAEIKELSLLSIQLLLEAEYGI